MTEFQQHAPKHPKGRSLLWPCLSIVGLSFLTGATALLLQGLVARALSQFALHPGGTGVFLPEEPSAAFLFPLRLFGAVFLIVAVCVATSWVLVASFRKAALVLVLLLCASSLLIALTLWGYRVRMQESVEVSMYGQTVVRTRGQMTRLGDVPLFTMGLLGPVILCAGAFAIGIRKRERADEESPAVQRTLND